MMILIGLGSTALALSVPLLGDISLGVLFGLAAIRNFVFAYLDWRVKKGKAVAKWLPYLLAGVFAAATITSTALLWQSGYALWLEILICVTLLGLILGNILKGTNLMRISFVLNRVFNIISHVFFGNIFAIITDSVSILANIGFYARRLDEKMGTKKIQNTAGIQENPQKLHHDPIESAFELHI